MLQPCFIFCTVAYSLSYYCNINNERWNLIVCINEVIPRNLTKDFLRFSAIKYL